jgi:hypothetical protein
VTNPQQFNPKTIAAQQALVRLLNTPPETIISMLDRLEVPWDKVKVDGYDGTCLVIEWTELVKGEQRLQREGPFIKKMVEEMKSDPQMFSGEQITNPLLGGN